MTGNEMKGYVMIAEDDLEVETVRRPPGGQHVGTSPQGVTVTHKPTGIRVFVDTERSNHRNIAIAKDAILGALTSPHFRW